MRVRVINAQRAVPVSLRRMTRVARGAIRRLGITISGELAITFIGPRRMRTLNKRFRRHDWTTDVLSFRYDHERIVGEILIAPSEALAYAKRHRLPYATELSRYVVHGLLHWLGHEDRTASEQRQMRAKETKLLLHCMTWK